MLETMQYVHHVHPDISWKIRSRQWGKDSEFPSRFHGTFPFWTYIDTEIQGTNFHCDCPLCGNDLLKFRYGPYEESSSVVDVKNYCDSCGAKIHVPHEDDPDYGRDEFEAPDGWQLLREDNLHKLVWVGMDEESIALGASDTTEAKSND